MYESTPEQIKAERTLMKQGFRFLRWLPAVPDANNDPSEGTEKLGTMLMARKNERREIEPDGTVR